MTWMTISATEERSIRTSGNHPYWLSAADHVGVTAIATMLVAPAGAARRTYPLVSVAPPDHSGVVADRLGRVEGAEHRPAAVGQRGIDGLGEVFLIVVGALARAGSVGSG